MKGIKTNNKGFSLVELIIVIAIMAILVAVLAPQYLRYVDRSRYRRDVQNVDNLYGAVQASLAMPELNGKWFVTGKDTANITFGTADDSFSLGDLSADMQLEICKSMGFLKSDGTADTTALAKAMKLNCDNWGDKDASGVTTPISGNTYPCIVIKKTGNATEWIPIYSNT